MCMGSKPSAPEVPPPPPAKEPAKEPNKEAQAGEGIARKQAIAASGVAGTVQTSGLGVSDPAEVQKKKLLGQ